MFSRLRAIFNSAPVSLEEWAMRNGSGVTPDEIMAAAVVQSFANNFDKWKAEGFDDPNTAYHARTGTLTHKDKKIVIRRIAEYKYNPTGPDFYRFNGIEINGVEISRKWEKFVLKGYEAIAKRRAAAEAAAKQAEQTMSINEKAWNLAETLLDMKRDENGALVPVKEI